ncbi:hypothetical protein BHG40_03810 [Aeromonas salmonicida subsp. masoucida]|nr:hypothetical protein BHG40_03810 [Aeromonas salmonicida subsp. masoucida]GAJ47069.1 hypothetical protein ASA01S_002_00010 [Aeromonas salmonicida subsp. masoucida NBRC 13784]
MVVLRSLGFQLVPFKLHRFRKQRRNTYFEFMVKQGSEQSDIEADSKYLLPGETYRNTKISQSGNQKLIVYQSRFIAVGKDCWPD